MRQQPASRWARGRMKAQVSIGAKDMAALAAGDAAHTARCLKEIAPTVWATISLLSIGDSEAREAFLDIMAQLRADNCARLRDYSGRGTWTTFVALTVRDLLAREILQLLHADREKGWRAFEALFAADIRRLIRKRLPGVEHEETRKDAYQDIGLALLGSDYGRLSAYQGRGSFAGFVLRTTDRLLINFIRNFSVRRRAKTQAGARANPRPARVDVDLQLIADLPERSPESLLLQEEEDRMQTAAFCVLLRAVDTMPAIEQLYLRLVLSAARTPPSRDIATLMQCPVEHIYKLKQRVLKRLREAIAEEPDIKNWRASV
jgi:DNA-directed RNA polymerase specialized sigma24 family protein